MLASSTYWDQGQLELHSNTHLKNTFKFKNTYTPLIKVYTSILPDVSICWESVYPFPPKGWVPTVLLFVFLGIQSFALDVVSSLFSFPAYVGIIWTTFSALFK